VDWVGEQCPADAPAVVLGDINIAPEARDLWDPVGWAATPTFHPEERARWARLIAQGLHDVVAARTPPNTYSFWDYRGGALYKKQGLRIDHVLVTAPLLDRVSAASIGRDWRKKKGDLKASDHAPVTVVLD
jgi:exodeoxyribonuclease-3